MSWPWPPRRRAASRVSPAELLHRLDARLTGSDATWVALLAITLDATDRQMATVQGSAERLALAEVERRLKEVLRGDDSYALVSREEVWVMLADIQGATVAELAAGTLLEHFRRPIETGAAAGALPTILLTPAVGGACAKTLTGVAATSLLAAAGKAAAERFGDSRIAIRQVDVRPDGAPPGAIEHDLGDALDWNALDVHFQPQVDLQTGQCSAAEALIRWRRHDGQVISPAKIVAICEERDLIGQLTRFTLNTSLRNMSQWLDEGLETIVSVNLSARTLSDPALPLMVAQALDTWGVPAGNLTLELTESALILDQGAAAGAMRELHRLGCRLSIDDFGTGYSPYTYLRQFSFHELKIDQAFVRRMAFDPADRKIVKSLVELARAFGMDTVGEGVEDQQTWQALGEIGCDLAQGWHLSAALPAEAFAAWRRDRTGRAGHPAPGEAGLASARPAPLAELQRASVRGVQPV
jgi:EAL domain-containing protein (putative c-di-GMP-specific phosphodiesterase class I)/GGDEF domain-containing protein